MGRLLAVAGAILATFLILPAAGAAAPPPAAPSGPPVASASPTTAGTTATPSVAASASAAAASASPSAAGSPAVPPSVSPSDVGRATAALRFLAEHQRPDGSLDGSVGETADLVIGAASGGYDPSTLRQCSAAGALDFLAAAGDAAAGDAAKTGKLVMAVAAAGRDPAAFAGRDLIARLAALYQPSTGAYGDGSTFAQSLAILGLAAAGRPAPAAAASRLRSLQDSDGSWNYQAGANSTPGDTNSTAVALMALVAAGEPAGGTAETSAIAYLHGQQLADGGFPYQNSSAFGPPQSDPDSDALVLQALVAIGQDPTGSSWTKGSASVLTQLRSSQAADGGFVFPGNAAADAFTTSQVPAALLGVPYPGRSAFTPGAAVPGVACATTGPVASPSLASPRPVATPRPTSHPTARSTPRPTVRPTTPTELDGGSIGPPVDRVPVTTTGSPAATSGPSPSPSPSPSVSAAASASASPAPSSAVAGAVSGGPSDGVPTAAAYGAAGLLAFLVVVGGGWLLVVRPRRT